MAFVSVQRAPKDSNSQHSSDSGAGSSLEEDEQISCSRSLKECYFAGIANSAALAALSSMDDMCQNKYSKSNNKRHHHNHHHHHHNHYRNHRRDFHQITTSSFSSSSNGSINGGFQPISAAANAADDDDAAAQTQSQRRSSNGCDIQQHLQSMFCLLRPEETLKMAVKLESVHPGRTRYLVVVSCIGRNQSEECCLLGIDCNQRTTVGLVLRVLADTTITLDGDGGFSVSVCGRQHIFKPVSVQAMWSALQTLHRVSLKAREANYFEGGVTHEWVSYYEQRIESDRSCLNQWHAMNDLQSKRPPSPDSLRSKPRERLETEQVIRNTLKEIMMSVDLDEVTSKYIRSRLEEQLDMDLREFKSFIDEEMLIILGQMDAATEIFPHVYLGSEWNASNLEELNKNGVCHILNVTREIDNFFPGMFNYLNIRVYDDDNTDLLKHWDNTFKYINKAKKDGSKVLVHCKMGISRSASVVIAYAMKAYNWDLKKAFDYVRKKRSCIKPNQNFITQLETYQGILDAMKNKEKLQRSKSETNLKCTSNFENSSEKHHHAAVTIKNEMEQENNKKPSNGEEMTDSSNLRMLRVCSGSELENMTSRRKSWSPDNLMESEIYNTTAGTMSQSLEHLNVTKSRDSQSSSVSSLSTSPPNIPPAPPLPPIDVRYYNSNVRMPCGNGLTYSVSQNKIVQLYSSRNREQNEGENENSNNNTNTLVEENTADSSTCKQADRRGLVLNLTSQFESSEGSTPPPPIYDSLPPVVPTGNLPSVVGNLPPVVPVVENLPSVVPVYGNLPPVVPPPTAATSAGILVKKEILDPGDGSLAPSSSASTNNCNDSTNICKIPVASTRPLFHRLNFRLLNKKEGDLFSNNLDRVFEKEEKRQKKLQKNSSASSAPNTANALMENQEKSYEISRQSSWSSYDSAVVLGGCGGGSSISRHSSWSSYDTNNKCSSSCQSSWGSYDLSLSSSSAQFLTEEPPAQLLPPRTEEPEQVEDDAAKIQDQELHIVEPVFLENTSPCIIDTTQCTSVRYHTTLLEKLTNQTPSKNRRKSDGEDDGNQRGIVLNLKKEFEAKCQQKSDKNSSNNLTMKKQNENLLVKSLPSSPVSEHSDYLHKPSPVASMEDLSVRKLVGKYEFKDRTKFLQNRNKNSSDLKKFGNFNRPPSLTVFGQNNSNFVNYKSFFVPTPDDIRMTVTKAANKLQQGKNLSKFCKSTRLNNPVYNTM